MTMNNQKARKIPGGGAAGQAANDADEATASVSIEMSPEKQRKATLSDKRDVQRHRVNEVMNTLSRRPDLSREDMNARVQSAYDMLAELAPRDHAERMLINQMIACHEAAMECMQIASTPGKSMEVCDMAWKHAEKLMATYQKQLAALDKHRGKGQQKVTVEHVHVGAGGQAIVGNVSTGEKPKAANDTMPALENKPGVPVDLDIETQKVERFGGGDD
jgi:uncharacterized protein (DUF305 family)